MTKRLKVSIVLTILLAISMIATVSLVYAESTTYSSYINCGDNSSVTGSERQYNQRNHKITLYPTELNYGDGGSIRMHIDLCKKGWFGTSSTVTTIDANIDSTYRTYSYGMGNHDTGKYYYYFSTFGSGYHGQIIANPVNMICYD